MHLVQYIQNCFKVYFVNKTVFDFIHGAYFCVHRNKYQYKPLDQAVYLTIVSTEATPH